MKRFVLFLIVVLLIIFCGYMLNNWNKKTTDFAYLKETDYIRLSTSIVNDEGTKREACETKIIDDAVRVKKITSKIQTYKHYWQYEHFSPPQTGSFGRLSPIQFAFYKDNQIETILTIGYLDGFGYYLQQPLGLGRHLSVEDLEEILDLIEIDKEVIDNQTACK